MVIAMSWIDQRSRNYLPSLQVRGDMTAIVEFISEPTTQNFGKKTTRKGDEVDDVRVRAKVKYIGGSATYIEEKVAYSAKTGEEYTLWIGSTLSAAFLEQLGWKENDPTPLMTGTRWKVWRGEYGRGGHRIYEAELLSGEFKPVPAPDPSKPEPEPEPEEFKITDEFLEEQSNSVKKLGEIDKETWSVFLQSKGVPSDQVESVTDKMVKKELLYANNISVSSKPLE